MSARKDMAVWVVVATLTAGAGMASAAHRSGCSKYADYLINWYNGGTGEYSTIYEKEARTDWNAWDPYTDVQFTRVLAAGSTDHINAYNGFYGATGWLMLTSIQRYSGCTIFQGQIRLNQTYLDGGSYTAANKEILACQGIGRLLGLSTTYGTTGCMSGTAPYPSTHDRDVINSIY
jgi:hypothetical protein